MPAPASDPASAESRAVGPAPTGTPVAAGPAHPALTAVLELLRCPQCGEELGIVGRAVRCSQGHTFDIGRQGYVSLLSGSRATSGDDAEMARARAAFLDSGTYAPIAGALAGLSARAIEAAGAEEASRCTVLDVGCGTGYYLARVLEELPHAHGLGVDTSVRALRHAARAHPRAAAASWDVYRPLPLADSSVDVLLSVFAPRSPEEFQRVLRAQGRLLVVRPTAEHLAELREAVPGMIAIEAAKEDRLHAALDPHFELDSTEQLETFVELTPQRAVDLVGMTPSARHVDVARLHENAQLPDHVTLSVLISAYRPR
ncbi:methyltransferase type 11 [Brachybacterium endophyticum]|uniref:Methyltransferase type 11 n=1 Tax=Brachybacterium endophyticum TaxID=2182385 RepID=A0A2U2RMZ8_9MICO|nr:methyltransferase domain-containing protein [Brachybacterium endophyticum]PWH07249.1 methyltransferase type 11 [Brachybacterium endophyticum]